MSIIKIESMSELNFKVPIRHLGEKKQTNIEGSRNVFSRKQLYAVWFILIFILLMITLHLSYFG